jgi:hypothetical protein
MSRYSPTSVRAPPLRWVSACGDGGDPPEHALVLSVDEKSEIQALDRARRSQRSFEVSSSD